MRQEPGGRHTAVRMQGLWPGDGGAVLLPGLRLTSPLNGPRVPLSSVLVKAVSMMHQHESTMHLPVLHALS